MDELHGDTSGSRSPDTRPTVIDLFAGCGGGSIGFAHAGFNVIAAVEIDQSAADAFKANVNVAPVTKDIRRVTGPKLLAAAGVARGECTLLFGCPPCQSFTLLRRGAKRRRIDVERNALPSQYLRLVRKVLPRHIAFENVPGMMEGGGRKRLDKLLHDLAKLEYLTRCDILDAADYGVPQRRQRVIVIGSRVTTPLWPEPSHGPGRAPYQTVRMAIGALPVPANDGHAGLDELHVARRHSEIALRRLRAIPAEGSRSSLPPDLVLDCHKDHNGHRDIYGRLAWDKVSSTLTSGCTNVTRGRFAHPEQHRAITLREALLLQSFPPTATVRGTVDSRSRQIGNAIPPLLAEALGRTVLQMEVASRHGPEKSCGASPHSVGRA